MNTFFLMMSISFIVMLVVIAGMSIGVLNGRKAISGSCGGLNGGKCELCSGRDQCKKRNGGDRA
ncbi:MAG: hypothetical protein QNJ19_02385 [Woeseiaceae bacterium]|nr:hypothetical protein [Woeseiaceae bacterium]